MPTKEKVTPDVQTMKTTAERLQIGIRQAYEAARRGDFPAIKIGGRWLVSIKRFERWLNGDEAA
jgi:hypothetical protein